MLPIELKCGGWYLGECSAGQQVRGSPFLWIRARPSGLTAVFPVQSQGFSWPSSAFCVR